MTTIRLAAAAMAGLTLSACASLMDIPQTRAALIAHPKIEHMSYTVPRPLEAVVASLNKGRDCTDTIHRQSSMSGSMLSVSKDAWYMTVETTAPGRAELTYRWASNNTGGQPPGGFYLMAGDLEAQGPRATRVTLHHGGRPALTNAIREWTLGNDQSCHGLSK